VYGGSFLEGVGEGRWGVCCDAREVVLVDGSWGPFTGRDCNPVSVCCSGNVLFRRYFGWLTGWGRVPWVWGSSWRTTYCLESERGGAMQLTGVVYFWAVHGDDLAGTGARSGNSEASVRKSSWVGRYAIVRVGLIVYSLFTGWGVYILKVIGTTLQEKDKKGTVLSFTSWMPKLLA